MREVTFRKNSMKVLYWIHNFQVVEALFPQVYRSQGKLTLEELQDLQDAELHTKSFQQNSF